MVVQFFFQGKSNELVKVFSMAKPDLKVQARDMLVKLDIATHRNIKTWNDTCQYYCFIFFFFL